MKLQPASRQEFKRIIIGVLAGCVLMVAVFAVIGKFSVSVPLGAVLGGGIAIGNFYYLCISVQKAMDSGDQAIAKKIMQTSYGRRMLICGVGIGIGLIVDWFHPVAVVAPMLMPRATILILQIAGVYKPDKPDKTENTPPAEAAEEE